MKSIIGIILLFFSIGCFALPECDKNRQRWDNCYGSRSTEDPRIQRSADRIYVGEWKNNKYHGRGKLTHLRGPNRGWTYTGEFRNDRKHGRGTYTSANGEIMRKGIWERGKFVQREDK